MDTTATTFDTEALRRGIEERNASTMRALYAPDAEMTVVDRNTPPSHPRVLRGRTVVLPWRTASADGRYSLIATA